MCKWTVDLTSLPTFQRNISIPQPNGFYTGTPNSPLLSPLNSDLIPMVAYVEFELGLELDSAEVSACTESACDDVSVTNGGLRHTGPGYLAL